MKNIFVLVLVVALLVIFGCAGEDNLGKDKIPPTAPILVPHLGDTGDQPVPYQGQTIDLDEGNNGIDTVPDGDWIKITWNPFIDSDLSHLKVFRFDEFNALPVYIDSVSALVNDYVDKSDLEVNTLYSYYIELVDIAGNSSVSDTVSYALLSKVILDSPQAGSIVPANNIVFTWDKSGFASRYRVIVFDQNHVYVWHQDLDVSTEEYSFSITAPVNLGPDYTGQTLFWRVDSFDMDNESGLHKGSESQERTINIQ